MQLHSIKFSVAMLWVSAVSAVGIAGHVRSLSGWAALTVIAILPPLVMTWRWSGPSQTMTESISEVLR